MFNKPHRAGAQCPPYCFSSIESAFRRYEAELVGTYVLDPLGTRVWFMDYNFPKLIQLCFQGSKAKATQAIKHLRVEPAAVADYTWDQSRFSTLFWIPDVIANPDAIHPNKHGRIIGDEVYIRKYAKAGACYKIAFTVVDETLNQRVVTTSFLTPPDRLRQFIGDPPKWTKKTKKEETPSSEGHLPFPEQKPPG